MSILVPSNRQPPTPGEVIKEEILEPLGLSAAKLAEHMNVPSSIIYQLLSGKRKLTAETALKLEAVTGVDVGFWMNLQIAYDVYTARKNDPTKGLKKLQELEQELS